MRRTTISAAVAALLAFPGSALAAGGWSIAAGSPYPGSLEGISCTSPSWCAAVGSRDNFDTLVENWNGHKWTAQPSPGKGLLYSVACADRKACWAVGTEGVRSLMERWNGGGWHLVRSSPAISTLSGVTCHGPSFCVAVGHSTPDAAILTWDGRTWSKTVTVADSYGAYLNSVSCTSSRFCIAVGSAIVSQSVAMSPIAEIWNGKQWTSIAPLPDHGHRTILEGISCTTDKSCVAVGQVNSNGSFAELWNGRAWIYTPKVPNPPGAGVSLNSVMCDASTNCVAVGDTSTSSPRSASVIEGWNGHTWHLEVSPRTGRYCTLSGVSLSSSLGAVVGGYGSSVESERSLVERGT